MIKSNLWKQRREKDGRLISIWKELRIECGDTRSMAEGRKPSRVEEDGKAADMEDPWLEELCLTETERTKLMELEQWQQTHKDQKTANKSDTIVQPPGTSSPQEIGSNSPALTSTSRNSTNTSQITVMQHQTDTPSGCLPEQNKPQTITASSHTLAVSCPLVMGQCAGDKTGARGVGRTDAGLGSRLFRTAGQPSFISTSQPGKYGTSISTNSTGKSETGFFTSSTGKSDLPASAHENMPSGCIPDKKSPKPQTSTFGSTRQTSTSFPHSSSSIVAPVIDQQITPSGCIPDKKMPQISNLSRKPITSTSPIQNSPISSSIAVTARRNRTASPSGCIPDKNKPQNVTASCNLQQKTSTAHTHSRHSSSSTAVPFMEQLTASPRGCIPNKNKPENVTASSNTQ